ncbi:hypothetical protein [Staphylococcus rostri]|uniref:hypothetical protein n=1 Tax=Staphylococcus rostri TaxID=522262 RepID=UPI001472A3ED|nr:hypothetical protein [Staphylococcus rostri]
MDLVTIKYAEFKRLVALEVRHQNEIALRDEEIQDLKMELNRLKREALLKNG